MLKDTPGCAQKSLRMVLGRPFGTGIKPSVWQVCQIYFSGPLILSYSQQRPHFHKRSLPLREKFKVFCFFLYVTIKLTKPLAPGMCVYVCMYVGFPITRNSMWYQLSVLVNSILLQSSYVCSHNKNTGPQVCPHPISDSNFKFMLLPGLWSNRL